MEWGAPPLKNPSILPWEWKSMKTNENQWKPLKINENQWKPLQINENKWKQMNIDRNYYLWVALSVK